MSKILYKVFLLFLLLPRFLFSDEITIVADEWCPYNCVPGSDKPGYVVEIASVIFAKAGHRVIYKTDSWNRTLDGVNKGIYNGAIAATPEELPEGIFSEENLGYYGNSFVVKTGSEWHYEAVSSLEKIRLGVIKDYNYGENINAYIKTSTNISAKSGSDAVKKNLGDLYKGKIDVYLEDHNVAYYESKQIGLEGKIKIAGSEGKPIALFIGFTHKNPNSKRHAQVLSDGIRALRASGKLESILKKYGLSDWK